jgi:hypothetical protein
MKKKIGLLCLALVFALGALGVGYAMWSDTLYIDGTVYTGDVDVEFSSQMPNDSGGAVADLSTGDPAEPGTWTYPDIDNPSTWTWSGAVQPETDPDYPEYKEVASIDCNIDQATSTLTVTIDHGYPSYFGGVGFTIDNLGTVPVKILSMKLITVNGNAPQGGAVDLTAGIQYYVDVAAPDEASRLAIVSETHDSQKVDGDDFSFILSHLALCDQIGAAGWDDDALFGDIAVHIEQGIPQGLGTAPARAYTFEIEIVCAQWNEVCTGN